MAAAVAHEVAMYSVCQVAAYAVCWKVSERLMPKAPDRAFAADALYGLFYYPALVLLALDATFRLYADVTTRWEGTVPSSQILGRLLLSRMLVHIPYLFLKKRTEDRRMLPLYLTHHAIVIVVYGLGTFRGRAHFWGAVNALCEVTNCFCTVIELFACVSSETKERWKPLHRWSSTWFGISYCVLRLTLFPMVFVWYMSDVITHPDLSWAKVGNAERIMYPLANLMVFGLSVAWALPVVRGTLRRLFGTKEQLAMAAETAAAAVVNEAAAAVAGRGDRESSNVDAPLSSPRLYQRHTSLVKSPQ